MDICFEDMNSLFFKNKLFFGFQFVFVFLADWLISWDFSTDLKCKRSVDARKLGVFVGFFLNVNVLDEMGVV